MVRVHYGDWTISTCFMGTRNALWDDDSIDRHHKVNIQYKGSKAVSFDLWASKAEPYINSRKKALEAFGVILSDAVYGYNIEDIDSFADEFGYSTSNIKISHIIEAYNGLRDAYIKLDSIVEGEFGVVNDTLLQLQEEGLC